MRFYSQPGGKYAHAQKCAYLRMYMRMNMRIFAHICAYMRILEQAHICACHCAMTRKTCATTRTKCAKMRSGADTGSCELFRLSAGATHDVKMSSELEGRRDLARNQPTRHPGPSPVARGSQIRRQPHGDPAGIRYEGNR